jgi:hypothetical protein
MLSQFANIGSQLCCYCTIESILISQREILLTKLMFFIWTNHILFLSVADCWDKILQNTCEYLFWMSTLSKTFICMKILHWFRNTCYKMCHQGRCLQRQPFSKKPMIGRKQTELIGARALVYLYIFKFVCDGIENQMTMPMRLSTCRDSVFTKQHIDYMWSKENAWRIFGVYE